MIRNKMRSHRVLNTRLKSIVTVIAFAAINMVINLSAGTISPTFFSQLNSAWANEKLGTSNWTLRQGGCAVTSAAMALSAKGVWVQPSTLNKWLIKNKGFANGYNLVWGKVADFDGAGGLQWVKVGSLPTTITAAKSLVDSGQILIVYSKRGEPSNDHWIILLGYVGRGNQWSDFVYFDPADNPKTLPATVRRVGDGWVAPGAAARIYK